MADTDPMARANVVYAIDERYVVPLTVSLLSLQDNSAGRVPVLVLCDEVSPELRARITAPLPDPDAVRFVEVDADRLPERLNVGLSARYSRVAYARLCVEEAAVDPWRFVYLDADTVVLRDIDDLRGLDLRGNTIGAVHDRTYSLFDGQTARLPRRSPGSAPQRFNSGVMLIDTVRWFQELPGPAALKTCRELNVMDQGGLNVACEGDWQPLGSEWNVTTQQLILSRRSSRSVAPAIRHLTSVKPWMRELSEEEQRRWHLDDFYDYLRRAQEALTTMDREGAVK